MNGLDWGGGMPSENGVSEAALPEGRRSFEAVEQRLRFSGDAGEYFKIWIVNLLLSVLTLSFYSPWAKVRRLRYFYGHTHLGGERFDFTAVPGRILIGRIIALVLFGVFSVLSELDSVYVLIAWALVLAVMPWLVRSTMRFWARNSKYGNIRFHFSASMKQSYWLFAKCALVTVFSLGLLYPLALYWFKSYQIDHLQAGRLKFKLNSSVGAFYGAVLKPYLMMLFGGMFLMLLLAVSGVGSELISGESEEISDTFFAMLTVLIVLFYAVMLGFFVPLTQGYLFSVTWRDVEVGRNRISTDLNPFKYAAIQFVNYVATVLSLGLLHPWAAVRIYRYRTESLTVKCFDRPEDLQNTEQDNPNPLGEEIADVFDLDISL